MQFILRMILNKLIGHAVNRGVDHFARGGKRLDDMSPAERQAYQRNKSQTRRMTQAARLARRFIR